MGSDTGSDINPMLGHTKAIAWHGFGHKNSEANWVIIPLSI